MARGPALTPDLPGSPVARESFVPMKVAQAEAPGGIIPFGLHATSRRTRRSADGESRKVEWQMIADEDD